MADSERRDRVLREVGVLEWKSVQSWKLADDCIWWAGQRTVFTQIIR